MIKQEIGKYRSFILEREDMVVVMGEVSKHRAFLDGTGFEEHPETKEWVGTGANLYAIAPDDFFDRFSAQKGVGPELQAQATDGTDFYQIDGLPLVEEDSGGKRYIARITALDLETRTLIDEGMANFRVG